MNNYKYKGISAGAYVEGDIEAGSTDEATFKLKEKKNNNNKFKNTKKKRKR